jgi:Ca2+-transporting ATPase
VYLPPLQAVFQTEAISVGDWAYIVAITSLVLWADEARKLWARREGVLALAAVGSWFRGRRRVRHGFSFGSNAEHKRTDTADGAASERVQLV